jgi:hypothetical protein
MKRSFLLLVCATLFSLNSSAQNDTTERMNRNRYGNRGDNARHQETDSMYGSQSRQSRDTMYRHGFVMESGRMMVVRNGVSTVLNTDTTLNNGTKIMRNGTIIMKNGTQRTLKEGEFVNMGGNIMPMRTREGTMMRDSLNKNNREGNRNMESEKNRARTERDSTNRKKDMYLVPDSAKHHYEKK